MKQIYLDYNSTTPIAKEAIEVLPATTFLDEYLAQDGVMGGIAPDKQSVSDIELGRRIAWEISRLDIGQTVVVKNGTVLAVEGFEGTDEAIIRGGTLGEGGVTVVKVSKPEQDMRFDVPCLGLDTVESLKAAGAKALAVQSGSTLILDRQGVITGLDEAGIAFVGFSS